MVAVFAKVPLGVERAHDVTDLVYGCNSKDEKCVLAYYSVAEIIIDTEAVCTVEISIFFFRATG